MGDPAASFQPPAEASPALVEIHRRFLASPVAEQRSKIAEIERQIAQKRAEHDTVAAAIGKLEATIPVFKQRLDIREELFDRALGSKINYLTDLQDLLGQQHDLEVQKSRALEADAPWQRLPRPGRRRSSNSAMPYSMTSPRQSRRRRGSPRT
jgi:hemolysin D